ncbi:MAG: RidA family protein [Leptolyngbyaceae cyanobacterium]|mgnify:CR=1 FL=1
MLSSSLTDKFAMLEFITLPDALPPVAPYSHAVRAGDFLFVTGQLAEDADSGEVLKLDIEAQTRQVMANLKRVLTHAGTQFENVVMVRIFVTDFRYYEVVNQVYASYFDQARLPSRTTVGITALAGYGDVEIDLIVYCGT